MTTILQNVRYSFRLLWKNPGFTLVAIATLALGIGANTAIFSVLYESLLAPMPYPDADRLMMVWSKIDGRNPVSAGDFTDWKRQNKTFQDLVAWSGGNYNLATPEQPEMVSGRIVSPGYYRMQGLDFFLGRDFTMADASLYHPLYFLGLIPPNFSIVKDFTNVNRWFERIRDLA